LLFPNKEGVNSLDRRRGFRNVGSIKEAHLELVVVAALGEIPRGAGRGAYRMSGRSKEDQILEELRRIRANQEAEAEWAELERRMACPMGGQHTIGNVEKINGRTVIYCGKCKQATNLR
jgi:hypothetical protein